MWTRTRNGKSLDGGFNYEPACLALTLVGFLAMSGSAFASEHTSFRQCTAAVDRLFVEYVTEANKAPPKVAQFFSQKVLASQVNGLFITPKNLETISNLLLPVREGGIIYKQVTCSDGGCRVQAISKTADGKQWRFALDYSSLQGTCETMLIVHQDFYVDPKNSKR